MKYVLDTNIFNRVLDDRFSLSTLQNICSFVATKIQIHELEASKEPRRAELLAIFNDVAPDLEAAAFCFNILGAGFNEGEFSSDDRITQIHASLEAIKPKLNNWQDALIAGIALKEGYVLVTADGNLAKVSADFGIKVHHVTT